MAKLLGHNLWLSQTEIIARIISPCIHCTHIVWQKYVLIAKSPLALYRKVPCFWSSFQFFLASTVYTQCISLISNPKIITMIQIPFIPTWICQSSQPDRHICTCTLVHGSFESRFPQLWPMSKSFSRRRGFMKYWHSTAALCFSFFSVFISFSPHTYVYT